MSWYTESYGWIKQQQVENPDMDHQELRKHCSKNYPFRERRGYAYKAFLQAMRDVFGAARKPKATAQGDLLKNTAGGCGELTKPTKKEIIMDLNQFRDEIVRIATEKYEHNEQTVRRNLDKALLEHAYMQSMGAEEAWLWMNEVKSS